jgi:hypothetical protein
MRTVQAVLVLCIALCGALVAGPADARFPGGETRALIIGVDSYPGRAALRGAVNDARVMHQALSWSRESVLLLNEQATVQRILTEWRRLNAASRPGDYVVVHFSGHGLRVPTRDSRNAIQTDSAFVTAEYDPRGRDPTSGLLLNSTIGEIASDMERRGLQLVLIADTCYSLGIIRGGCGQGNAPCRSVDFDPTGFQPIQVNDGPVQLGQTGPNVILIAAALESEAVREIQFNGQNHGALSVAIAEALAGLADMNRDGRVTLGELDRYVASRTRRLGHGQQASVHAHGRGPETEFVRLAGTAPPATERQMSTLFVDGPALPAGILPDGIRLVRDRDVAELTWRASTGLVLRFNGDILAYGVHDSSSLRDVLHRRMIVARLDAVARRRPLDVVVTLQPDLALQRDLPQTLAEAARRAEQGPFLARQMAHVVAAQTPERHTVVFSFSSNGQVHRIFPHPTARTTVPSAGQRYQQPVCAVAPFGSTMVVLVSAPRPLDTLQTAVDAAVDRLVPESVVAAVEAAVQQGAWLGIAEVLTSPEQPAAPDSRCR